MRQISIAEAKVHLGKIIDGVAAGEPVTITRRGKPVAQTIPVQGVLQPVDVDALLAVSTGMPVQPETAAEFMQRLRRSARY